MSCCKTSVKGGQRVLNNGRGCSARGLPGDEVRLEDEAEHDALAKGKAPVRRELRSSRQGQCSGRQRASVQRTARHAARGSEPCRPLENALSNSSSASGSVMGALRLALAVLSLSGAACFGGMERFARDPNDPQGGVPHNGNGFFSQPNLPFGGNGHPGTGGPAYNVEFSTSKYVLPARDMHAPALTQSAIPDPRTLPHRKNLCTPSHVLCSCIMSQPPLWRSLCRSRSGTASHSPLPLAS